MTDSLGAADAVSTFVLVIGVTASAMTNVVAGWLGVKAVAEMEVVDGLGEDVEVAELILMLLDDSANEEDSDTGALRRRVRNGPPVIEFDLTLLMTQM